MDVFVAPSFQEARGSSAAKAGSLASSVTSTTRTPITDARRRVPTKILDRRDNTGFPDLQMSDTCLPGSTLPAYADPAQVLRPCPSIVGWAISHPSMVPRERVKRERRASRLDRSGPGISRRLPPQLSAACRWPVRPSRVGVTEPDGSGRQGQRRRGSHPRSSRARRPAIVAPIKPPGGVSRRPETAMSAIQGGARRPSHLRHQRRPA